MKMIVVVALALVAAAAAAPTKEPATILENEFDQQPNGEYKTRSKTSDGIEKEEIGELREVFDEDKKPHYVIVVRGQVSYPREDGTVEIIKYVSDENGYQPEGPSIPKNE